MIRFQSVLLFADGLEPTPKKGHCKMKTINSKEVLQDVLAAGIDDNLKDTLNSKYSLGHLSLTALYIVGDIADRRKVVKLHTTLLRLDQGGPTSNRTTNTELRNVANSDAEDIYPQYFFCDILIDRIGKILHDDSNCIENVNAIAILNGLPSSDPLTQCPNLCGSDEEMNFLQHIAALKQAWLAGHHRIDETYASMLASYRAFTQ